MAFEREGEQQQRGKSDKTKFFINRREINPPASRGRGKGGHRGSLDNCATGTRASRRGIVTEVAPQAPYAAHKVGEVKSYQSGKELVVRRGKNTSARFKGPKKRLLLSLGDKWGVFGKSSGPEEAHRRETNRKNVLQDLRKRRKEKCSLQNLRRIRPRVGQEPEEGGGRRYGTREKT